MAERRMFAKTIVLSDAFLDMPLSARCLYFTLGMFADDDGFVNAPKAIMRQCGASEDDLKLLIAKKFIIIFESGVIVIKHWRINNYLRNDRYQETKYSDEKTLLSINQNGAYTLSEHSEEIPGIPNSGIPNSVDTQNRLGKDSIGKDSIGKDRLGDVCSEPQGVTEQEADTVLIPLNDGSGWRPSVSDYDEWCRVYPNVDIQREFERMRQWCLSNPAKRKTKRGIRRFVTNWLDGEQNRPKKKRSESTGADAYFEMAQEAMYGTGGN